jgi:dihydrofolate synthase/folylpolyglutamate synthase
MDHMNLLGNSIEQIAFEKAGIIKRQVPVVSAPQVPEAMDVIRRVARMRGARLIIPHPPEAQPGVRLPLLGAHQRINASVAVTALQVANERGLVVSEAAIRNGLQTVQWPGRLEVLNRDPLVVVDGAHNGDSAQKLADALRDVFHIDRWTVILGISADKDIAAILDALLPIAGRFILTRASNSRAANVEALGAQVAARGYEPTLTASVAEALESGLRDRPPIIITGSLFTVADAREAWFKRIGQPLEKDE